MSLKLATVISVLAICSGVCLCNWGQMISPHSSLVDILYNSNVSRPNNSANDDSNLEILRNEDGQLSMLELYSLLPYNSYRTIDGNLAASYAVLRYTHYWKCTKTNLDSVRRLCESTQIAGLKRFCQYGEQKLNDLCRRDTNVTIESLLRKSCLSQYEEVKGIERLVGEAELTYSQFTHFVEVNGRGNNPIEKNVYDFCRQTSESLLSPMVGNCLSFYATITNQFNYLGADTNSMILMVSNMAGRSIYEPLNLCGHVVDICGLTIV